MDRLRFKAWRVQELTSYPMAMGRMRAMRFPAAIDRAVGDQAPYLYVLVDAAIETLLPFFNGMTTDASKCTLIPGAELPRGLYETWRKLQRLEMAVEPGEDAGTNAADVGESTAPLADDASASASPLSIS